jgi:hypothetical protein
MICGALALAGALALLPMVRVRPMDAAAAL